MHQANLCENLSICYGVIGMSPIFSHVLDKVDKVNGGETIIR